jgi:type IV pilus assembly protein PilC
MAATGEEAGESAEMFANVAESLEDELDAMVATLGARLEVALLMVMGAVVGSLLVVLYLPILNLTQVAGDGYSGGNS